MAANNPLPLGNAATLTAPAQNSFVVTPSDVTNIQGGFRALYIGGSGDVNVVNNDDSAVVFVGVLPGSILPVSGKRVNLASTTATNIVGLR